MINEPLTIAERIWKFFIKNFVVEIIVAVGAGLLVAYIAQEGRFAPEKVSPLSQPQADVATVESSGISITEVPEVTIISAPTEIIGVKSASEFVPGAEVTYQTKFDDMIGWGGFGTTDFANGVLTLQGTSAGAGHETLLRKGNGILVLFRCTPGGSANVVFFNAPSNGSKMIGIQIRDGFRVSLNYDGAWYGGQDLNGNLRFEANHWYYALIQINKGGQFYLKVWDNDNVDTYVEKTLPMGTQWENSSWYGSMTINDDNIGRIEIASYQEFHFGD